MQAQPVHAVIVLRIARDRVDVTAFVRQRFLDPSASTPIVPSSARRIRSCSSWQLRTRHCRLRAAARRRRRGSRPSSCDSPGCWSRRAKNAFVRCAVFRLFRNASVASDMRRLLRNEAGTVPPFQGPPAFGDTTGAAPTVRGAPKATAAIAPAAPSRSRRLVPWSWCSSCRWDDDTRFLSGEPARCAGRALQSIVSGESPRRLHTHRAS